MARVGKIIDINDGVAWIAMAANEACDGCEACGHGSNDTEQKIEALNELDAEVGDTVEFDMTIPSLLGAAFIAYTVPLLTMVLSIFLTIVILKGLGFGNNAELIASLIGFFTLFMTYVVIRKFDPRMRDSKRFMATITRIVIKSKQEVFLNVEQKM